MKKKTSYIIIFAVCAIAGVILGLFTWSDKPANPRIQSGIRQIVQEEPSLKPMYDEAMSDGVLTLGEVKVILSKAKELKRSR